jgi:ATP-dependent DNA helicase RecG
MFPREAFREILLNAVVHKDYASCNSIQISVYDDEIYIWNDGWMPENLRTTESLFAKHSSKPFNPKLAHVFFISGMIEAWGRGFDKIRSACDALYHTPMPEYDIGAGGIMVHCRANAKYMELGMENRLGLSETILRQLRDETRENVIQIMEMVELKDSITSSEVQVKLGKPKPTVARILKKMCEMNLLKMVGGGRSARYQKSSQRV